MHRPALRPSFFLPAALAIALVWTAVFSSSALAHEGEHNDAPDFDTGEAVVVPRDWAFTPEGLDNGDTFRLLVVTCGTHDAMSGDISHYNDFVQEEVRAGGSELAGYAEQFRVLGSTSEVDARDNTRTNPTEQGDGTAIYWAMGSRVADDYPDFYDGDWDNTDPGRLADGSAIDFSPDEYIFTGTRTDGTAARQAPRRATGGGRSRSFCAIGLSRSQHGTDRSLLRASRSVLAILRVVRPLQGRGFERPPATCSSVEVIRPVCHTARRAEHGASV